MEECVRELCGPPFPPFLPPSSSSSARSCARTYLSIHALPLTQSWSGFYSAQRLRGSASHLPRRDFQSTRDHSRAKANLLLVVGVLLLALLGSWLLFWLCLLRLGLIESATRCTELTKRACADSAMMQ